jgi:hypothetical protein
VSRSAHWPDRRENRVCDPKRTPAEAGRLRALRGTAAGADKASIAREGGYLLSTAGHFRAARASRRRRRRRDPIFLIRAEQKYPIRTETLLAEHREKPPPGDAEWNDGARRRADTWRDIADGAFASDATGGGMAGAGAHTYRRISAGARSIADEAQHCVDASTRTGVNSLSGSGFLRLCGAVHRG